MVITFNNRIKVTGDFTTTFNLHITSVKEEDRGQYMCQLNTNPMISQVPFSVTSLHRRLNRFPLLMLTNDLYTLFQSASLDVMVPPDIDNEKSSDDIILKTGSNAKLECQANGYPKPTISWIRDKTFYTPKESKNMIKAKDPATGLIRFC